MMPAGPLRALLPVQQWPKLVQPRGRSLWPWWQLEMLRLHYASQPTTLLAQAIGRPAGQVYAQAGKLGLGKGPEFLATAASGRLLKGGRLGQAHQFGPGHTPWNKGVTGLDVGGRETRFKPGNRPKTWVPVGTLRITPDDTLERKVCDLPGPPNVRWKSVHSLVWQAANGPVPAGHIVVFKPGRRSTELARITVDALDCITRAQNMARNTIHARLPKELVHLVQLRGAIHRQINRRERATTAEGPKA